VDRSVQMLGLHPVWDHSHKALIVCSAWSGNGVTYSAGLVWKGKNIIIFDNTADSSKLHFAVNYPIHHGCSEKH